jgi:aryl-alcohol dehydrogenase-like predicted oxidoreductase
MMQYATLGQTGLVVSRLAYGVMTFGTGDLAPGVKNDTTQKDADRLVGMCLDAGVNLFDTADLYQFGETEKMLGRALGSRRREVVISTKAGFRNSQHLLDAGLSYRHIHDAADASLKRLGTDWIDIFQVHIVDDITPIEETARALEDLVRSGKVRYVGFSNWPAWKAARLLAVQERHGWQPIKAAQLLYSLVQRDLEHELADFLVDAGIGLLVYSPLAFGLLSGKYSRDAPAPADSRLGRWDSPINLFDADLAYDAIDRLRTIAEAHGASVAQVAIAWLLTRPIVSSILIGATKAYQLEDNLKAADLVLTPEELDELDRLTQPELIYPRSVIRMGVDAMYRDKLAKRAV